jgi:cytoskeleton protein RodZ
MAEKHRERTSLTGRLQRAIWGPDDYEAVDRFGHGLDSLGSVLHPDHDRPASDPPPDETPHVHIIHGPPPARTKRRGRPSRRFKSTRRTSAATRRPAERKAPDDPMERPAVALPSRFPVASGPSPVVDLAETGALLREARESLALTLEEIARETSIPVRHLEALEEGRRSALPTGVYLAGYVRTVAGCVGVDSEALLRPGEPLSAPRLGTRPEGRRSSHRPVSSRRLFGWAAAAVVLGLIVASALRGDRSTLQPLEPDRAGVAAPTTTTAVPAPPSTPAPTTPVRTAALTEGDESEAHFSVPGGPFELVVSASAPCWIQAREFQAGRVLFEGLLTAGQVQRFTGTTLWVRLGNADGASVTVNGSPLALPPGHRTVFNLVLLTETTA